MCGRTTEIAFSHSSKQKTMFILIPKEYFQVSWNGTRNWTCIL